MMQLLVCSEITSINSLMYLDVSTNQITDNLPPQWSGLSNLNLLKLDNNQLTGTLLISMYPCEE